MEFLLELFVFIGLVFYDQGDHRPRPLQACSCLLVGHLLNVLTIHLRGKRGEGRGERKEGEREGEGRRERKKRERERGRRGREKETEREKGRREGEREKKRVKGRRGGGKGLNSIARRGST